MAGRKATSNPAVAVALVALLVVATASGAAGLFCNVDTDSVKAACGSYCTVGSTEDAPKEECCKAMKPADFSCLCRYKNFLRSRGNNIDPNRAMQIPSKCNIPGAPASC